MRSIFISKQQVASIKQIIYRFVAGLLLPTSYLLLRPEGAYENC